MSREPKNEIWFLRAFGYYVNVTRGDLVRSEGFVNYIDTLSGEAPEIVTALNIWCAPTELKAYRLMRDFYLDRITEAERKIKQLEATHG